VNTKKFLAHYEITTDSGNAAVPSAIKKRVDEDYLFILDRLGGKTFNDGIFRVYRGDQVVEATKTITSMFAAVKITAIAFGYDWLGRQFVVDSSEMNDGKPTVVCLEPGVPNSYCTDKPIVPFFNEDLVTMADAALSESLFKKWRKKHKKPIAPDECVGYKTPLFLGGEDNLDNMELTDLDVYLTLCAKLWNKVKDLPDGTPIGEISIEDE
jgi:hypothetical protein